MESFFNFKCNSPKHCNNLISKPHYLSIRWIPTWWISWWNSLWGIVMYEYHRKGVTSSQDEQIPVGSTTVFPSTYLIHCCKPMFPDPALDNSLATMTARANQQDNAWKPSNYCWHIQSFLIFSHWFWSLTPTMAPTWATLGTLWSFPSCFQQVGSFPECPKEVGQRQKLWHLFHLGKLKQCFPIFLWVEKILKCCFLFQFSTKTYWNSCLLKHSSPS